jgi:protocatechuate 3,4-dioxygenase beta subunit
LFLTLRLVVGWRRLSRLSRDAQAPPSDWRLAELQRVRQALSLNHLPAVALCPQARVPMVVGLVHPRVVLPEALAAEMSASEFTQTLIHECAHVRRRDPWVLALQRLALVVLWPHPLLHYLNRELERAREELCDNHVLAAARPAAYAETLLRLAQACLPAPEWGARMAMLRQGAELERRIRRLVDVHRERDIAMARWPRFGVALLMTFLAAGVSAVQVQLGLHELKTAAYNPSEKVIDDEVQREVRAQGDRVSFIRALEAEGITLAQHRARVRKRLIEMALQDERPSTESASRPNSSGQAQAEPSASRSSTAQPSATGYTNTIEGRVLSPAGEPLAGVRVWPQRIEPGLSDKKWGPAIEPVVSGADGTFRMTGVPAGSYVIFSRFDTNATPAWVANTVWVSVTNRAALRGVDVAATRGGFLEVLASAEPGLGPVAHAHIKVASEVSFAYITEADADDYGLVLLRLPAGNYRVSASKGHSSCGALTATVEPGWTNRTELRLRPASKAGGLVYDPAGVPAPGVTVEVLPSDYPSRDVTASRADGSYEVSWNPTRVLMNFNSFCLVARDEARNLASALDLEAGTNRLDVRLGAGMILAGRVEDPNGLPITNAVVKVSLRTGYIWPDIERVAADSRGRFSLSALPANRKYTVDAAAKGYGSARRDVQGSDFQNHRTQLEPFVLRVADRRIAGLVLDDQDQPIAGAWVFFGGEGQQRKEPACTDGDGRFVFEEVCAGEIRLNSNTQTARGAVRAQAGDTHIVLKLRSGASAARAPAQRASRIGQTLPDLAPLGLEASAPAGRPVLLCLFDLEQRPCRRLLQLLAERHEQLTQKGLAVLAVQAAGATIESFKQWKDANPMPFPVGRVTEESGQAKWATGVESLPWLILTDAKHQVVAEGSAIEELAAALGEPGPAQVSDASIRSNITVVAGQPLDRAAPVAVQSNLEATGRLARVIRRNAAGELVTTNVVVPSAWVRDIRFVGNTKFSDAELLRWISTKVGGPLDDQKLLMDAELIRKAYEQAGANDAGVKYSYAVETEPGRAAVRFEILVPSGRAK